MNRGCIPTKALLYASGMFHMMQSSDAFGVFTDFISFDFGKMQKYKDEAVEKYRAGIEEAFRKKGVDIIYGNGVLRRDRTVEVDLAEGGKEFFQGRYVVIATGAVPIMEGIPGSDLPGVWDSDRLLAAKTWSFDRLTIIGGGVIAVELATIFNNLCSHVTIVEKRKHLMGSMDTVMSQELESTLRQKGIAIYCDCTVADIYQGEGGLWCRIEPNDGGEAVTTRAGQVHTRSRVGPTRRVLQGRTYPSRWMGQRLQCPRSLRPASPGFTPSGMSAPGPSWPMWLRRRLCMWWSVWRKGLTASA